VPPFEIDNDPRQPHRELWKQVVVGDGERELEPAPKNGVCHKNISCSYPCGFSDALTLPNRRMG
jgi:hypothetical protein